MEQWPGIIRPAGTYFGLKKSEFKSPGIVHSEYDYMKAATPWHFLENPYFIYILKGNLLDIN